MVDPNSGATSSGPAACQPGPLATPPSGIVTRIAGATRDDTAIAASQAAYAATGSANAVVLASDATFPDALAGTPLAVARHAPLLLTTPAGLTASVSAEIRRVAPRGATVLVLGGDLALSPTIDTQIAALGDTPLRVAGPDRFATAVAIAGLLGDPPAILEATGLDFPDALSAGAAAAKAGGAVLLTNGAAQAGATATYLGAHAGDRRFAIGGPAASADATATAISGTDRFDTAVRVAQQFYPSGPAILGFASGATFPDALGGGAASHGPLLLVPACGTLPATLTTYLSGLSGAVTNASLFGGTSAVGDDVLAQLDQTA
jgi:putative cell wall-binding protein